jgi:hypothetical protein
MLWDALSDDLAGAVGSNWSPVGAATAYRFMEEMASAPGWERGHVAAPRCGASPLR